jgi:hypothetical protein
MDKKTPVIVTGTPVSDTASTKGDEANITGDPEKVITNVAISTDTEWKITIQNRDGTKSEVMLSPVSPKSPTRQDIRIIMPLAQTNEQKDPEIEKKPTGNMVSDLL